MHRSFPTNTILYFLSDLLSGYTALCSIVYLHRGQVYEKEYSPPLRRHAGQLPGNEIGTPTGGSGLVSGAGSSRLCRCRRRRLCGGRSRCLGFYPDSDLSLPDVVEKETQEYDDDKDYADDDPRRDVVVFVVVYRIRIDPSRWRREVRETRIILRIVVLLH